MNKNDIKELYCSILATCHWTMTDIVVKEMVKDLATAKQEVTR